MVRGFEFIGLAAAAILAAPRRLGYGGGVLVVDDSGPVTAEMLKEVPARRIPLLPSDPREPMVPYRPKRQEPVQEFTGRRSGLFGMMGISARPVIEEAPPAEPYRPTGSKRSRRRNRGRG